MSELTEFLLREIAAREAPSWSLVPYRCEPGCCAPAGWVGHACHICGTEEFGGTVEAMTETAEEHAEQIHERARVLADCEALRAVVALHSGPQYGRDDAHLCVDSMTDDDECETLLALAQPFAGRPGWRDEWRTNPA